MCIPTRTRANLLRPAQVAFCLHFTGQQLNMHPSPADIEAPYWWAYHQSLPKFHQSNKTYQLRLPKDRCPVKIDGSKMDEDERKKYELVLTETAVLVFRGRRNPEDLLVTLDGGFPKDSSPEECPDLGKTILNAVSYVCGITLREVQMISHLGVSVFFKISAISLTYSKILVKSIPRGKCSYCDCEDCDYSSTDDATRCHTCNHEIVHHRLLLARGRIQAELEAEFERLERLFDTIHKENWKESRFGHDRLSSLF